MNLILDILVWACLIPAAGFTIDYFAFGLHRKRPVEGWHILTFTACLAFVFVVLLVPDFPGRRPLLIALVAGVSIALWWRWALLRQVRREVRRRQKEKARAVAD